MRFLLLLWSARGVPALTTSTTVYPGTLRGTVAVPASKSHTIRALLIAALADGESHINNALDSADARSCITALETFGADVQIGTEAAQGLSVSVQGVGPRVFGSSSADLRIDVGNSGTTLFLATALSALRTGKTRFDGDASIRTRSAGPLLHALTDLGATVSFEGTPDHAPFTITGPLVGGKTAIECPTSQYLSALLLAAPLIYGDHDAGPPGTVSESSDESAGASARGTTTDNELTTTVEVPLLYERPYVDMTLSWLDNQGIAYQRKEYARFSVPGGQSFQPFHRALEGD